MCLLRCIATVFVWCLAAAQDPDGSSEEAVLVPIVHLLADDSGMVGKRALNPFTDSVGKRYLHSPIGINYPSPHLGMYRRTHAKNPKNSQLEMLPVDAAKRQYFDSLAGQSLGARRYFDALAFLCTFVGRHWRSNGVSHAGGSFTASRRTPKQTLMDFIPPPPPGVPPPTTSAPVRRRDPPPDDYDSVNEALLRYRSSSPLDPVVERTRFPAANTRGRDALRNGAPDRQFSPAFCDVAADSQRSSLMCSTADNRSCSSEADEENSEEEENFQMALNKRALASPQPPSVEYGVRPVQPCMGVSASALTQSSYDSTSALRTGGKLKTLPRNGRKDFV